MAWVLPSHRSPPFTDLSSYRELEFSLTFPFSSPYPFFLHSKIPFLLLLLLLFVNFSFSAVLDDLNVSGVSIS